MRKEDLHVVIASEPRSGVSPSREPGFRPPRAHDTYNPENLERRSR